MSRFQALKDFERRFETMGVDELKQWKVYWTNHAQQLAPKVRKQAMKRVYAIENAIEGRTQQDAMPMRQIERQGRLSPIAELGVESQQS